MASPRISAIRTTGIYCVPGCPARPLERNRQRFHAAETAEEHGYRACLRCRPDREPAMLSIDAAPSLVEAMLGAVAHWLPGTEGEPGPDEVAHHFATSFGLSLTEVQTLFQDHVGSPIERIANRRRDALARSLLEQTDLSRAAVARGAGFRSAGALDDAMKATFRFDAEELRDRRFACERQAASAGPTIRLHLPYWRERNVAGIFGYLASRAIPGVEQVVDGVYERSILARSGEATWVAIAPDDQPRPNDDCGHLRLTIGDVALLDGPGELLDTVIRCRHLFGLDVAPPGHALRNDLTLGPLVAKAPGLRLAGAWDRFEAAVRIIVGQQVTVAAASTLAGRIAQMLGTARDLPNGLTHSFPTPAVVAEADLGAMGMPKSRGQTVVNFAQAVVAGDVDLNAVGSLEDVVAPMLEVKGIGPWTAQLIAARVLRQPDAFPPKDLGLERAWTALGGVESVEVAAKRWQPHRAAAIAYLWMYA